jgi:small subunit ribosomal protein S5
MEQIMARDNRRESGEKAAPEFDERVIDIARVAKVVKGGRHFTFRTVVVVGDNHGRVGIGMGKSRVVPDAIRKGTEHARREMHPVPLSKTTIPHEVTGRCGGAVVLLKPASPGTGVIAAGGVRAVLEAAGIHDILTKSMGSANVLNVVSATMDALNQLKDPAVLAAIRGKDARYLLPFWERKTND